MNAIVDVTIDGNARLDSYSATGGIIAAISVVVRNSGTSSVWYDLRSNSLKRREGGRWVEVWAQASTPRLSASTSVGLQGTEIAAGERLAIEVEVRTWLGQGWTAPLGGEYRINAGLFDEAGQITDEASRSAPFHFDIRIH